ncbi:N-acetyltransferase 9-like protein isoform X2 [Homalodisca vitripennis]|uniref:N-acetyltransferase 9-like protein isoform X1 n=1 Tax=Homalodisca vitripennis TaxID=197043 RepID=UPI001EEB84BB|nr:N-acetyltransferase 9-like protein isoform X1 [Homalodisca vitripennis]XP_046659611.1 N-acetyltransferase 9-like protein isoform X2 [Homalodisca vitripennis]
MKKNCRTRIIGRAVILVPYRKIHVPKYHRWMQSTELQELTASEPLTEEEEFEMQQTWFADENKCTFIVLDRKIYEEGSNEVDAMIGDTNLYLVEEDGTLTAETGVMIAEESVRGMGRGREAMLLMLSYGATCLSVKKYIAKISTSNEISINMFKKLGFEVESESSIFKEVTLSVEVSQKWLSWLDNQTCHRQIQEEDVGFS